MDWIIRFTAVAVLLLLVEYLVYRKWAMAGLSYDRAFTVRQAFEGETVLMRETIRNEKPLPIPLLTVESRMNGNLLLSSHANLEVNDIGYHKSLFTLLPFSKITRTHRVTCLKRGYYQVKSLAICIHDLFGLVRVAENEITVAAGIVVYPRLYDPGLFELPSHSLMGSMIVRRWIAEDPFLVSGIREYESGDPMKSVNWKASARTGGMKVNQFEHSANTRLMMLLNVESSQEQWGRDGDTEPVEHGISLCATLAQKAIENGMEAGFSANGRKADGSKGIIDIDCMSGEQQLYALWESMAMLELRRIMSFHTFLQTHAESGLRGCDILIFTTYVDEEIDQQATLLRMAGNSVEYWMLESQAGQEAGLQSAESGLRYEESVNPMDGIASHHDHSEYGASHFSMKRPEHEGGAA